MAFVGILHKRGEGEESWRRDSSENTLVLFISGGDEMENINKITPLRRVSVCVMMNQKEGSL